MRSDEYVKSLESALPATQKLPAIFLAHGSPSLVMPSGATPPALASLGPDGDLAHFLDTFGPFLLERYHPKGIVVFSAHFESRDGIEILDNDENKLYYDYYGFPDALYKLQWRSKGSSNLVGRIEELLNSKNISNRRSQNQRGLDHGVFAPFLHMFPLQEKAVFPIPVVEVSMHASADPQELIRLGQALSPLRDEQILIICGGLSIHNLRDFSQFNSGSASQDVKDFERSVIQAAESPAEHRLEALAGLMQHRGFQKAHPTAEHFVPLYIASGAGSEGSARTLCDVHGAVSIAFGV